MLRLASSCSLVALAFVSLAACSDDTLTPLAPSSRPDASYDAGAGTPPTTVDGSIDPGKLECGVAIATTYDGASFATNTVEERALVAKVDALSKLMRDVEAGTGVVTPEGLTAAFEDGPKAAMTAYYVPRVEATLATYAAEHAKVYTPSEPPPVEGGKLGKYVVDARAVDLRQMVDKGMHGAVFFHRALALAAAGVDGKALDRILALYGANPAFPNNPDAATSPDLWGAKYAAQRDAKDPSKPGLYVATKNAFLRAQTAIKAGAPCTADRDAAVAEIFALWEKSQIATAVFYVHDTIAKIASAAPAADTVHALTEGIGLVEGFRMLPAGTTKATTATIDAALEAMLAPVGGAPTVYTTVTDGAGAAAKLQGALAKVAAIEGFSDAEVASFKTKY